MNDDNNELFYSIFYFENPENINIKYSFDMNEIENKSSKLLILIIIICIIILIIIGIIIVVKKKNKNIEDLGEEKVNESELTDITFDLGKEN